MSPEAASLQADEVDPGGLNEAALSALWQRVRESRDATAREELICHFMPLARTVAATLYGRRFHDEIEFAEYLQWATLGMIEALDRFDPDFGVKFSSFASHHMRGAILDGISTSTEKQQQIALRTRLQQERLKSVVVDSSEENGPARGAPAGGADSLLQRLADIGVGLALAWLLDDTGMVASGEDEPDAQHVPYLDVLEYQQLQKHVHSLVDALPTQQRTVLKSHYLQGLSFSEIASFMHLSRGRISQIHSKALSDLRQSFRVKRSCDVFG
ncbi:MAG: sigma-70 family RNA polymerase sigma factor [Curvibacter sp.]|nr:sigma-70 family RNA polymerase sigma factor [Curvibacter sp.]